MAAAALILAACGNEEFIENVENGAAEQLVPMTFTANMPQTRTYLSGGSLYGVGLSGEYWSNNIMYTGSDVLVFSIYTSGSVTTRMDSNFGNAYPVRCQKE